MKIWILRSSLFATPSLDYHDVLFIGYKLQERSLFTKLANTKMFFWGMGEGAVGEISIFCEKFEIPAKTSVNFLNIHFWRKTFDGC